MRRLGLGLLALAMAGPAMAQVIGVQPQPLGLYAWDPVANQYARITTSGTAAPAPTTPQPGAFFLYNSTLGQWTAAQKDTNGNIIMPVTATLAQGLTGNPSIGVTNITSVGSIIGCVVNGWITPNPSCPTYPADNTGNTANASATVTAINNAIAAVGPSNAKGVLLIPGRYATNSNIVLNGQVSLNGSGSASVIAPTGQLALTAATSIQMLTPGSSGTPATGQMNLASGNQLVNGSLFYFTGLATGISCGNGSMTSVNMVISSNPAVNPVNFSTNASTYNCSGSAATGTVNGQNPLTAVRLLGGGSYPGTGPQLHNLLVDSTAWNVQVTSSSYSAGTVTLNLNNLNGNGQQIVQAGNQFFLNGIPAANITCTGLINTDQTPLTATATQVTFAPANGVTCSSWTVPANTGVVEQRTGLNQSAAVDNESSGFIVDSVVTNSSGGAPGYYCIGCANGIETNNQIYYSAADGMEHHGCAHGITNAHNVVYGSGDDSYSINSYQTDSCTSNGITVDSASYNSGNRCFEVNGGQNISFSGYCENPRSEAFVVGGGSFRQASNVTFNKITGTGGQYGIFLQSVDGVNYPTDTVKVDAVTMVGLTDKGVVGGTAPTTYTQSVSNLTINAGTISYATVTVASVPATLRRGESITATGLTGYTCSLGSPNITSVVTGFSTSANTITFLLPAATTTCSNSSGASSGSVSVAMATVTNLKVTGSSFQYYSLSTPASTAGMFFQSTNGVLVEGSTVQNYPQWAIQTTAGNSGTLTIRDFTQDHDGWSGTVSYGLALGNSGFNRMEVHNITTLSDPRFSYGGALTFGSDSPQVEMDQLGGDVCAYTAGSAHLANVFTTDCNPNGTGAATQNYGNQGLTTFANGFAFNASTGGSGGVFNVVTGTGATSSFIGSMNFSTGATLFAPPSQATPSQNFNSEGAGWVNSWNDGTNVHGCQMLYQNIPGAGNSPVSTLTALAIDCAPGTVLNQTVWGSVADPVLSATAYNGAGTATVSVCGAGNNGTANCPNGNAAGTTGVTTAAVDTGSPCDSRECTFHFTTGTAGLGAGDLFFITLPTAKSKNVNPVCMNAGLTTTTWGNVTLDNANSSTTVGYVYYASTLTGGTTFHFTCVY